MHIALQQIETYCSYIITIVLQKYSVQHSEKLDVLIQEV